MLKRYEWQYGGILTAVNDHYIDEDCEIEALWCPY